MRGAQLACLVFMSILALMVYSLLEMLARRSGIMTVWGKNKNLVTARKLMFVFGTITLVQHRLRDGSEIRVVEDLASVQQLLLKKLKFASPQSYTID